LLAKLGFVAGAGRIDLQLRMAKDDPAEQQLQVTVLLRPAVGGARSTHVANHPEWQRCCDRIYRDLRSYLMGQSG
jgi:hypothetical protein